jgi:cytochrome oxidase Cu insertion factor (SCO1/SenC/PrrC family)
MEAGAPTRLRSRSGPLGPGLIVAALLLAGLVGVGVGVALHVTLARPAPAVMAGPSHGALDGQATWRAGARPAPGITTLRDQTDRLFSLVSLRGRTVAMTFFDSHCTQACPLEGRALAAAERSLPAVNRPVLVVVSVNPLDTPASTREAVRAWGLAGLAPWHWLRGTPKQLAPVWKEYHIFVAPPVNGDIAHTEALYLIDRRGYERSAYLYPFAPRFATHDLAALAGNRRS